MKNNNGLKRFKADDVKLIFQFVFLGIIFNEILLLSKVISIKINTYLAGYEFDFSILSFCLLTCILGVYYFIRRGGLSDIGAFLKGKRLDLSLILVGSFFVSHRVGGFGFSFYEDFLKGIEPIKFISIIGIALTPCFFLPVIDFLWSIKYIKNKYTGNRGLPIFIGDEPIEDKEDDFLGMQEKAEVFALQILNGGSSESMIFGVDSPWGTGKSSFVRLCENYLTSIRAKTIFFKFEPMRYGEEEDLTRFFIDDLVKTIKNNIYLPTVKNTFSRYLKNTKGTQKISFLGFELELDLSPDSDSLADTIEQLEEIIGGLDYKIIVVIDDLDRISWSSVKNILFAVKRSFTLPNMTYVLCYDTKNITKTNHDDASYVIQFLEKFIGVKINLHMDSLAITDYIEKRFSVSLKRFLLKDVRELDNIKEIVRCLVDIIKSNDYVHYANFIGDMRKLKRLINTIILLRLDDKNIVNVDYSNQDLVHLLLLYVNYPHIFRDILNSETDGRCGNFSLNYQYDDVQDKWKKSSYLEGYLDFVGEGENFILNKIFSEVPDKNSDDYQSERANRAKFNGEMGAWNLARHLKLIVNMEMQAEEESYQFYISMKDKLKDHGVEVVFGDEKFSFVNGEFVRYKLWKATANSAVEFSRESIISTIDYLIKNLPSYSCIEHVYMGAGARQGLIYPLLKMLDSAGWGESQVNRRDNSDEKIYEVSEWILGEKNHSGVGIVDKLSSPDRGVLGLYDLMAFRLYCSADRNNSLFNVTRSLSLNAGGDAPIQGATTEIAKAGMRKISQKIFSIFKEQYIEKDVNIFNLIDSLLIEGIMAASSQFVRNNVDQNLISQDDVNRNIESAKALIKVFVIYQLSNRLIQSGVGCGYYDEDGDSDSGGIAITMNDYLFNHCFNPLLNEKNAELFLDFMLINMVRSFNPFDEIEYSPRIDQYLSIFDGEWLVSYWEKHGEYIKSKNYHEMDKIVNSMSYYASYKEDLASIYEVLDTYFHSFTSSSKDTSDDTKS